MAFTAIGISHSLPLSRKTGDVPVCLRLYTKHIVADLHRVSPPITLERNMTKVMRMAGLKASPRVLLV